MNNLKILITKLSTTTRTALEKSANFCITQQNYEIEIEHLFYELLNQDQKNDLIILLEKYKISKDGLLDDIKETISQLPKGNSRTPIFAKSIVRLLEQAWLLASAEKNPVIRSGHLLVALLTAPDLYQIAIRASSLFDLFPIDTMKHKFLDICVKSAEQQSETDNVQSQNGEQASTDGNSETAAPKTPKMGGLTLSLVVSLKSVSCWIFSCVVVRTTLF